MSTVSYIKSIANKVIDEYDNLNPIDIVKSLKRVEFQTLPLTKNINGFYEYISPNKQMIVINENLSGEDFYITLFHELSHYFLEHKNDFLLNASFTSTLKEEYQADLLATYLYLHYIEKRCDYEDITYPKRVCELMKYFK